MSLHCTLGHENSPDNRFCRLCGEPLSGEPLRFAAQGELGGQVLALRYRVVRELGHGGFGRTYLAEDTNRFSEFCVLKEFAPQVQGTQALQKAEELFAREADVLYRLQHPQIPRFRELFRAEVQGKGRLFLVQDYIEGETYQQILRSRQQQGQVFSEAEVTQLLHQLLPVLIYLHNKGVIHRDISPDNLIRRTADGLPVLIDFGGVKHIAATVALQMHQPVSSGSTRIGKDGYAPLEQMDTGEASPHSDLYALAVTVLVLLTGQEPQDLLKDDRRQWQKTVKLSRSLVNVLDRMLSPYPNKRYQSAIEVLQALGEPPQVAPGATEPSQGSTYSNTIALAPAPSFTALHPNTIALAPATPAIVPQPRSLPARPTHPRSPRNWNWLVLLVLLGLATGSVYGVLLVNRMTVQPFWKFPSLPSFGWPGSTTSDPAIPKTEPERKQLIDSRRRQLGIDEGFLISLVDEAFFAQHPIGRSLGKGDADAPLRADWDKLALQFLNPLASLSAEARSRLGRYTQADLEQRRAVVNQINLSGRALNDLTDARFFALFPTVPRDPNLLQKTIGQVWQGVSADQVKALQSGSTLEQVRFAPGATSQQMSGTLKPGEGKAYLASLKKDQTLQLKLQASKQLALSLYPPTSKAAALLEDSGETEWSGRLLDSGLYEIVVVSNRSELTTYTIDLSATNP